MLRRARCARPDDAEDADPRFVPVALVSVSVLTWGRFQLLLEKNGDLSWSLVDALRGLAPPLWGSKKGTLLHLVQMAIGHTGKSGIFPTLDFTTPTFSSFPKMQPRLS